MLDTTLSKPLSRRLFQTIKGMQTEKPDYSAGGLLQSLIATVTVVDQECLSRGVPKCNIYESLFTKEWSNDRIYPP